MEDFVTYQITKKLKEKGFPIKCKEIIYGDNGLFAPTTPTIEQVLKWFREEKNIHLIVEIADSGWYYTLYPNVRWEDGKLKSDKYIMSFKNKNSYEEAALAGIEYVLDKLI